MTDPREPGSGQADQDRQTYWDSFYAATRVAERPLPSQFAAFVAGELDGPRRIVELGSGGGRDSIFFSSLGHDVTGVDASTSAVESASALAERLGERANFIASAIDAPNLSSRIAVVPGSTVIYARFFVHAITEAEEDAFLDLAVQLTSAGDRLAVEYRTVRDSSNVKVTGAHYRRFVSPPQFDAKASVHGFQVTYAVEGFGFAKYKLDDAYVARALFVRR